jgi:arylsulfatase A-like enzyme
VDYPYNKGFTDTFLPAHPSLPLYFSRRGYGTRCGGKIHHGGAIDLKDLPLESPYWYREWYYDAAGNRVAIDDLQALLGDDARREAARAGGFVDDYVQRHDGKPPAYECADAADTDYRDGRLAASAVDAIRRHAADGAPFFVAAGFYKPHLPFNAPKRYWDLYDRERFVLPANRRLAANVTPLAPASYELPAYDGGQIDFGDEARLRLLTHGYYACASFTDANIGKLLDELERQKLADRTIVMLWSDHGFHLGENQSFGKHTCFEVATRSPLIVAAPGFKGGQVCRALTEYVDIFPTMCDLAGLEKPDYLEGASLVPFLEDPARPGKTAAFSQWPRNKNAEGFSIRTDRHRYTEWRSRSGEGPRAGDVVARELYDHETDAFEAVNLADEQPALVAELSAKLAAGWRAAQAG